MHKKQNSAEELQLHYAAAIGNKNKHLNVGLDSVLFRFSLYCCNLWA